MGTFKYFNRTDNVEIDITPNSDGSGLDIYIEWRNENVEGYHDGGEITVGIDDIKQLVEMAETAAIISERGEDVDA